MMVTPQNVWASEGCFQLYYLTLVRFACIKFKRLHDIVPIIFNRLRGISSWI